MLVNAFDGSVAMEIPASAGSDYEAPVSFTWLVKPAPSVTVAKFAVGSHHQVEVFQIVHDTNSGTYSINSTGILRKFATPAVQSAFQKELLKHADPPICSGRTPSAGGPRLGEADSEG